MEGSEEWRRSEKGKAAKEEEEEKREEEEEEKEEEAAGRRLSDISPAEGRNVTTCGSSDPTDPVPTVRYVTAVSVADRLSTKVQSGSKHSFMFIANRKRSSYMSRPWT